MSKKDFSRREFLAVGAAVTAGCFLSRPVVAEKKAPALTLSRCDEIRLLQFTDLHLFAGISHQPEISEVQRRQTIDDMRRLIDHTRPDLLVITGDFWHENPDGRGMEFLNFSVEKVGGLGVPWVFTWGNHDKLDDYDLGHKALAAASNSLYGGTLESRGDYITPVLDGNGNVLLELFCLNTEGHGVDAKIRLFVRDAVAKEAEDFKRPMRMGAFHIPIRHHDHVWENGRARGVKGEPVCFEGEDGSALSAFKEAGIQAVMCGHDHTNDYSGRAEGVELIYGRASGYNGYGGETLEKGAKLYRLDPARSSLHWESVVPDGRRWNPGPTERRLIDS
ncbi:MAG: hypothetical protein GX130_08500 [Candidatus Hydrogenedens sp.]|jgi:hypothetical protein|nr:hypothetical protein [Candidatus Hydrogenedens sp.]